jgi:hypothetical protein
MLTTKLTTDMKSKSKSPKSREKELRKIKTEKSLRRKIIYGSTMQSAANNPFSTHINKPRLQDKQL